MAYCSKCGAQVNDDMRFCPACGAQIPQQAAQAQPQPEAQPQQAAAERPQAAAGQPAGGLGQTLQGLNNTADETVGCEQADIDQNKLMAVLSYLSILVLVPIFAAPKSKFARFHANQGLILAILEILYYTAVAIINGIFAAILPWQLFWLRALISAIFSLCGLVFLVWVILGIINVANGRAKELPIIGKFRILK